MSQLKAGKLQTGISLTTANNFVLDASADDGTLVLKRENGTTVLSFDASGNMDTPPANVYTMENILDTVSQSGGVPTGGIIERGSNANGSYAKFTDGTLICHHAITDSSPSGGSYTSPLYYYTKAWTFPSVFVSTSDLVVSGVSTDNATYGMLSKTAGMTVSAVTLVHITKTSAPAEVYFNMKAVGRWF